jgi:WD40 repeat protein
LLQTLDGHGAAVRSVAFSCGKLASASDDKTVKLWNAESGVSQWSETTDWERHKNWSYVKSNNCVTFSPDGILASACWDVKLWDSVAGTVLRTIDISPGTVDGILFSPDGTMLVVLQTWEITLYETSGSVMWKIESNMRKFDAVAFSPDCETLVCGGEQEHLVRLDVASGTELSCRPGRFDKIKALVYSPDGKTLALGSTRDDIRLLDASSTTDLRTLKGHTRQVNGLAFSSNGHLASASSDWTIKIWDVTSGIVLNTLEGHSNSVNAVVFNGKILASASSDNMVKLWDTSGAKSEPLEGYSKSVYMTVVSPNSKLLMLANRDTTVQMWSAEAEALLWTWCSKLAEEDTFARYRRSRDWYTTPVYRVTFTPDSELLAVALRDGAIFLMSADTGAPLRICDGDGGFNRFEQAAISIVLSSDGHLLAVSRRNAKIQLWNTRTGRMTWSTSCMRSPEHFFCYQYPPPPEAQVFIIDMAFSPDSSLLALAGNDHTIRVYGIPPEEEITRLEAESAHIVFSPDSKILASASFNHITLWDVASHQLLYTLEHLGNIYLMTFSPTGKQIATVSGDIKIWDVQSGAAVQSLNVDCQIQSLAFSDDETYLQTNRRRLYISNSAAPTCPFVRQQWISRGTANALWIPPDQRPFSSAVCRDIFCLCYESGKVTFMVLHS